MKLSYTDSSRHQRNRGIIKVTPEMEAFIKDHMSDIIIYSRSVFNNCQFFERIIGSFPNSGDYDLRPGREWDHIDHFDLSINRCPEYGEDKLPFLFTRFKLGRPSPGNQNDCSGVRYIIEDRLPALVSTTITPAEEATVAIPEQCRASSSVDEFAHLRSEIVVTDRDSEMELAVAESSGQTCSSEQSTDGCVAGASINLDNAISRLQNMFELVQSVWKKLSQDNDQQTTSTVSAEEDLSADEPPLKRMRTMDTQAIAKRWEDTSNFKQDWIGLIKLHQIQYINPSSITKQIKTWLVYHYNPQESKFSCSFCTSRAKDANVDKKYLPALADAEGYFIATQRRLYKQIIEHDKTKFHQDAITQMKESYKSNLESYIT